MKIDVEGIENVLVIIVLKKNKKFINSQDIFSFFFTWELAKLILFWNYVSKELLMKLKVILPKPTPMNHCH